MTLVGHSTGGAIANETPLLDDILAEPDFADAELARLTVPLLLCYATRGTQETRQSGTRLAQRVPDARLVLVEGGHFLPIDAAAAVTAAIRDTLHA